MIIIALLLVFGAQASPGFAENETWSSTTMEASAILGEMKFQEGDLPGADRPFRNSLDASIRLDDPRAQIVGLDLFRTAQIAIRKKDTVTARRNLEILASRYPDSAWARAASGLLRTLPKPQAGSDSGEDLAPVPQGMGGPDAQLRRLRSAWRSDQTTSALAEAEDFLTRHPSDERVHEVRVLAGALSLKLKEPARALRFLRQAKERAPAGQARDKAAYLLAAAYMALDQFSEVLRTVPQDDEGGSAWIARARVFRAAALAKVGRADQARRLYSAFLSGKIVSPIRTYALAARAEDLDREDRLPEVYSTLALAEEQGQHWRQTDLAASARLAIAHVHYRQQHFVQAAEDYAYFTRSYPDDLQCPLAYYQQGLALRRLGRRGAAVKVFDRLLSLYPESVYAPEAHMQLGQLHEAAGSHGKAIAHYGKLEEKEALLLTAQVHYNGGRYAQAIPLYWKYLQDEPDNARSREVKGLLLNAYWMSSASEDPDMLRAVELYPDHPVAANILLRRAERLAKQGDLSGAAEAWDSFLGRHGRDPRARAATFRLAEAYYGLAQYASSARTYGRIAGSDDLALKACFNRALALEKAGDKGGSISAYEDFTRRFAQHKQAAFAWLAIAEAKEKAGDWESAMAAYRKTLSLNRSRAVFRIGRCQERLKRQDLAKLSYGQLLSYTPATDYYRLQGLLRLALFCELSDPNKSKRLYQEIVRRTDESNPSGVTARRRLAALSGR
ncbi:MAG TPA: hypothetical protein DEB40_13800 [Elusimicrobia bacterium]|nr:hypothetical protein [Elusimicrobiota bacterium]HBT62807.1 hypothetical protein [Elusimicrobiota bacterium]